MRKVDSKVLQVIGQNLKEVRLQRKLTQLELAKNAHINVSYYGEIERGTANLSVETLEDILNVLNVKSSKILPF